MKGKRNSRVVPPFPESARKFLSGILLAFRVNLAIQPFSSS